MRENGVGNTLEAAVNRLQQDIGGECPMVRLLDTLSGKWSFPILYALILASGPVRFRELQRRVHPITQKELTKHLRSFEALGLVRREIYPEVPPRVEYAISDYGRTLRAPLSALAEWSITEGKPLFDAKARRGVGASAGASTVSKYRSQSKPARLLTGRRSGG
jgi:Predicted transcriptional regulators